MKDMKILKGWITVYPDVSSYITKSFGLVTVALLSQAVDIKKV
jgi:hypothetical protein